jgi:hypothetical protein
MRRMMSTGGIRRINVWMGGVASARAEKAGGPASKTAVATVNMAILAMF